MKTPTYSVLNIAYKPTIKNMSTVRNFEAMSGKLNIDSIRIKVISTSQEEEEEEDDDDDDDDDNNFRNDTKRAFNRFCTKKKKHLY
jgi:hypothetical protein